MLNISKVSLVAALLVAVGVVAGIVVGYSWSVHVQNTTVQEGRAR